MRSHSELLSQVESILFISGDPVKIDAIQEGLGLSDSEFEEILIDLYRKYTALESGISLIVTGESLQLVSKPENYQVVREVLKTEKKRALSKAAYEVLAIIAYTEPVTRIELEAIRGVNSSSALQHLLDLGLVTDCGEKDVIGRPQMFKTTEYFLQTAKLNSLDELPEYETFKERLKSIES